MERSGQFADASASYDDARYVIVGVPFDRTTSFRPGARFGPDSIRQHSWHFESYDLETGLDLADIPVHDFGNTGEFGNSEEMARGVRDVIAPILRAGKIPLTLGGDHSCSPPCVEAFPKDARIGVLYLDAHMDFRDSYLGDRRSHACSARRMVEKVGARHIVVVGVRSASREEIEANRSIGMAYISANEVIQSGVLPTVRKALQQLETDLIYVSLDIDVIDPAYAGATGTPEPFGLTPRAIQQIFCEVGPRLVGMDVMEVSPSYDQGNTSAVAARLVREAILRSAPNPR